MTKADQPMPTTKPTLQWSEEEAPAAVVDGEHLDQLLDDLAARARPELPTAVRLRCHGCEADVLLGLPKSIVYLTELGPRHYYISLGDPSAEGTTEFYLLGVHHTEWENRHLVPLATARRVVREFFDTGKRPASMHWEEGCF